jgi:hypothetical protein
MKGMDAIAPVQAIEQRQQDAYMADMRKEMESVENAKTTGLRNQAIVDMAKRHDVAIVTKPGMLGTDIDYGATYALTVQKIMQGIPQGQSQALMQELMGLLGKNIKDATNAPAPAAPAAPAQPAQPNPADKAILDTVSNNPQFKNLPNGSVVKHSGRLIMKTENGPVFK